MDIKVTRNPPHHPQSEEPTMPSQQIDLAGLLALRTDRKAEAALEPDTLQAASQVLAALSDPNGNTLPAEALRVLIAKNHKLLNDTDEAVADSLTLQAHLLEHVFLRYTRRAETLSNIQHKQLAMKIALAAQRQLLLTLGALHQLRGKQNGKSMPAEQTLVEIDGAED